MRNRNVLSLPAFSFQALPSTSKSSKSPPCSKMSTTEMPTASVVEASSALDLDALVTTLKNLDAADLFKVMKQALGEAEKRMKGTTRGAKGTTTAKKAGSMPKGVVPPQLRKPRAWVEFVLAHALENGWEAFTVYQTRKDRATGEKVEEEIEMPGSEMVNDAWVYEGSVTDKTPAGKQLIQKDAMSLSKQYWAPKEKKGTRPELYEEFEASYVEEDIPVADDASETSSKVVIRKTAAEKTAESEAKKAAKEAEKAEKKAAKEAEKETKKAEKEAEKAAKKAEKEAEKEAKKADKESAKKPVSKTPIPAAAVKAPVKTATPAPVVKAAPALPKKAVVKKEDWSCPADGMVHPWPYKGKQYLRNSDNEVWVRSADGGCGEWQGIYLPAEDRIDDSVPEPVFEDEE